MADRERARWGELANAALERHGHEARIDHRSHAERGIEAEPSQHLGPQAHGYERRTGQPSAKRIQQEQEAAERLARAKALGELERQGKALDRGIIDLSGDMREALRERDQLQAERDRKPAAPSQDELRAGMEAARAQFEAHKLAEAGKAQAREAFERFKAEQRAAELARQQAAEKAAQELARQREEAEHQAPPRGPNKDSPPGLRPAPMALLGVGRHAPRPPWAAPPGAPSRTGPLLPRSSSRRGSGHGCDGGGGGQAAGLSMPDA